MTLGLETVPAARHARMALALGAAGAIATLMLLPYALRLLPPNVAAGVPLPLLLAAQGLQAFAVLSIAAWLGLKLGYTFGLDAPWLRRMLDAGTPATERTPAWGRAAALGVGSASVVLALLALHPLGVAPAGGAPPWWTGLLASFYGGSSEEILCRLLLMSLIVWAGARLLGAAPRALFGFAIVLAALLFGAAHVPQAVHLLGRFDAAIATQVVALNAICGVAFGWLFWRFGLEHAMLAHFCADLVLHVAAPLLGGAG